MNMYPFVVNDLSTLIDKESPVSRPFVVPVVLPVFVTVPRFMSFAIGNISVSAKINCC